jgi:hypothetical protein
MSQTTPLDCPDGGWCRTNSYKRTSPEPQCANNVGPTDDCAGTIGGIGLSDASQGLRIAEHGQSLFQFGET